MGVNMEWQPISNAPHGEDLLLTDGVEIITTGIWIDGWIHNADESFRPTHWMPLPEPPA